MQWKLFHKKSSFRWSLFFNCYSADCFVYIATKLLFYCWCWETLSFVEGYSRTLIQLQLLLFNNMHAFRVYFLSTEHNEGPEKGFYFQIRLNHLSVFIKTSNSNLEVILVLELIELEFRLLKIQAVFNSIFKHLANQTYLMDLQTTDCIIINRHSHVDIYSLNLQRMVVCS